MKSIRLPNKGMKVAALLAAAVALTACQHRQFTTSSFTPAPAGTSQYPISVERSEVRLNLDVDPGMQGLTAVQRSQVSAFINGYRRSAGGQIVVRAPSGTTNESAARNALLDVNSVLEENHIPRNAVRFMPYGNGSTGNPPIVLSYLGYKAVSSSCGNWTSNLSLTTHNRISPNFGCASQRNLAAMVEDPRDLQRPRAMDPSSAERRDVVRGKYVKGEPTATESSDDNQGSVSEVGQ